MNKTSAVNSRQRGGSVKIHLAVTGPGVFGSTLTSTLCGRMSAESRDGMNSTGDRAQVTCAHCWAILRDPGHWRARKYLAA